MSKISPEPLAQKLVGLLVHGFEDWVLKRKNN